jgi:hypothetical protein
VISHGRQEKSNEEESSKEGKEGTFFLSFDSIQQ